MPTGASYRASKSAWKTFFLVLNVLFQLEFVVYLCAFVWFAPLLDAVFPLFESATTWKWIFPFIAIPLAMLMFFLVSSLKKSDGSDSGEFKLTILLATGLIYAGALLAVIIVNIIEWVDHCTSSSSSPRSYCYDGVSLTPQFEFVFWTLVVHFVLFSVMLAVAWYAMRSKLINISPGQVSTVNSKARMAYSQVEMEQGQTSSIWQ